MILKLQLQIIINKSNLLDTTEVDDGPPITYQNVLHREEARSGPETPQKCFNLRKRYNLSS